MTEHDSASSMMLDRNLAVVLSRLAGLLGQAVPSHRFGMMSRTTDGLMVDHLSREERLKAWWLGRFPTAHIHAVDPKHLKPWDLEPYYSIHVSAMTTEQLHDKADIAEQLAWRDQRIVKLQDEITALTHCTSATEPQQSGAQGEAGTKG